MCISVTIAVNSSNCMIKWVTACVSDRYDDSDLWIHQLMIYTHHDKEQLSTNKWVYLPCNGIYSRAGFILSRQVFHRNSQLLPLQSKHQPSN